MATEEKTTVNGSCHCGFIKYTCNIKIDKASGSFNVVRCNCTYCQKLDAAGLTLGGQDDFKLISPASRNELGHYQGTTKTVHRYFCPTCGVTAWREGYVMINGEKYEFIATNLATIDQPQDGIDVCNAKLKYVDGLNNNWTAPPRDTPWPGGMP